MEVKFDIFVSILSDKKKIQCNEVIKVHSSIITKMLNVAKFKWFINSVIPLHSPNNNCSLCKVLKPFLWTLPNRRTSVMWLSLHHGINVLRGSFVLYIRMDILQHVERNCQWQDSDTFVPWQHPRFTRVVHWTDKFSFFLSPSLNHIKWHLKLFILFVYPGSLMKRS